jgi:O-antigen/teichoic acid export membrane protein
MNQPRQIFKNTVALGLSDLVIRIGNVALVFLVARKLEAAGLGIYAAANEFFALIIMVGLMGVTNYLVREIAKDPSSTNRYVIHLSVMVSVISAALSALALIIVPHLGYSKELELSVYLITLAVIPGALSTVFDAVLIAHERAEFVTYTSLVTTLVNVGIGLFLLMQGYGVVSLVVAIVVIQYVSMFLLLYFTNRHIVALHWEFDLTFLRSQVEELKVFAALSILSGLFARPEIILLSVLQSETEIGYYSAALKIAVLWEAISSVFMTSMFPVLSRTFHRADESSQLIQDKAIKYLLAISLPLAVGITVTAEPTIALLFGPGFEASVPAAQVLAWSVPVLFISDVLWRVLIARDQQDLVLQVRAITLVTRLGMGILLISKWGALGAAVTMVANWLLSDIMLAYYVRREGFHLNLWRIGKRFAASALGMGVATWFLSQYLHLILLVPVAMIVYAFLVLLLKAFSPDDFALFRKVWQPQMAK